MKTNRDLLILLSLAASTFGLAAQPATYSPPASAREVATTKADWHDSKRDRVVPVKIYSPKHGAGPFPIVVFSHGLGGSRDGYEYLGRHWAGCGYVSVHLQHAGSDSAVWQKLPPAERAGAMQKSGASLASALNRPLDVKFALDELERLNGKKEFPLYGRLDLKHVGVSGHSFGGYTTLAIAGQTFVLERSGPQLADPRFTAAIQMSAPVGKARANLDQVYDSIKIPVMHLTGTKDFVALFPDTTAEDRRIPYDHMRNAETCFVNFKDGDHMIFSGAPRLSDGERARDATFQKLICVGTTAFWDAYLRGDAAAKSWLLSGGYAKLLGEDASFESKVR